MSQTTPYPLVPLGEIADIFLGISSSRVQALADTRSSTENEPTPITKPKLDGDEVCLVQVRDIVEAAKLGFDLVETGYRPFEGHLVPMEQLTDRFPRNPEIKWENFRIEAGDVLLSSKGSLLKSAIVRPETAGAIATSNLIILRPKANRVLPMVLLAMLRLEDTDTALRGNSRSTIMPISLTVKVVEKIQVPCPPLNIQAKLAETLEALEVYVRETLTTVSLRTSLVCSLVEKTIRETTDGEPKEDVR